MMMARLVKEKKLTDENFRVGLTKVFFKVSSSGYKLSQLLSESVITFL